MIGAWPIQLDRLLPYMEKACREAKQMTSWLAPNEEFEAATRKFIEALYGSTRFMKSFEDFVAPLVRPGWINSLTQTLLKLTAPGIPDTYQGEELWELNLVDPDNRRSVDYARRRQLLKELPGLSVDQVWQRIEEGLPKLWITYHALRVRRERPHAFGDVRRVRTLARLWSAGATLYRLFSSVRRYWWWLRALTGSSAVTGKLPGYKYPRAIGKMCLPARNGQAKLSCSPISASLSGGTTGENLAGSCNHKEMHTFSVWAPDARTVAVRIGSCAYPLQQADGGWWKRRLDEAKPGTEYMFDLDGNGPLPDPEVGLSNPEGVNGPSRVIDHSAFEWTDTHWQPQPLSSGIVYELHVGTFTARGHFLKRHRAPRSSGRSRCYSC